MSIAAIFAKREAAKKRKAKLAADKAKGLGGKNEGDKLLGGADDGDDAMEDRVFGQPMDFQLVDEEANLKTVLKQYDNLFWLFNEKGHFPSREMIKILSPGRFMQGKAWQNGDGRIPRDQIMYTGCIEWCVVHAFSGATDHVGKIQSSNNNQILVAALLLSVTGGQYLNPQDLGDDTLQTIFVALLGAATFIQLFNLVGYIAVAQLINDPYSPALSMYARVEADFYIKFLSYTVYAGVGAFLAALILVAYVGNVIDLYVMVPLVFPLIVFFCYILYQTSRTGYELRKETVYEFYEAFCEPDGRLSQRWLDIVYSDFETLLKVSDAGNDAGGDAGGDDAATEKTTDSN